MRSLYAFSAGGGGNAAVVWLGMRAFYNGVWLWLSDMTPVNGEFTQRRHYDVIMLYCKNCDSSSVDKVVTIRRYNVELQPTAWVIDTYTVR